MAASAWQFYDSFADHLGKGDIDLSGTNFKMALFTTTTGFASDALSVYGSLSNEVTSANGYVAGGDSLASETWSAGASAGVMRFDAADPVWTASGGTIAGVKGAVVYQSGASAGISYLVAWSTLTTTGDIDITDGNTLTVQLHASGIFELAKS